MSDAPLFDGRQACYGMDTEVFFPDEAGVTGSAQAKEAKDVCARCDQIHACLAYALPRAGVHGVWGGTTELERRDMRRRLKITPTRPKDPSPCGTTAAYQAHYRRGERPCTPCKQAYNKYQQQRRDIGA